MPIDCPTPESRSPRISRAALERAEHLAGDRNVGIFGGEMAGQALELSRLDEIIVQVVPVVLGDGTPRFGSKRRPQAQLERIHVGASGPLTDIRFRVVG